MLASLGLCFGLLVSIAAGAPVNSTTPSPEETTDCNNEDVYDQRQNGTENYRIHVNGVVVLVAPAETILQAAQLPNLQTEMESEISSETTVVQPKPKPQTASDKVPAQGHALDTAYASSQANKESMKHDKEETTLQ